MGSYAACSLLVGLSAGSDGGVSLCSASSRPAHVGAQASQELRAEDRLHLQHPGEGN